MNHVRWYSHHPRLWLLLVSLSFALLLTGCPFVGVEPIDPTPSPQPPTPTATPLTVDPTDVPALDTNALANATYQTDVTDDGTLTLTDGVYSAPTAPGAASLVFVTSGWAPVFGDFNGDNITDAAVILVANTGGSGTFYYLHAVLNQGGVPQNVAYTLLGDRVVLNAVEIAPDGTIAVAMKRQGDDDPMCCPTLDVVQTYALQEDELALLAEEIVLKAVDAAADTVADDATAEEGEETPSSDAEGTSASSSAESTDELVTSPAIPVDLTTLTATTWQLLAYGRAATPQLVLDGSTVTANFDENGGLGGVAGCNNYVSSYQIEDGVVRIAPPGLTRKLCPNSDVMAQENDFVKALAAARTMQFVGAQLHIDYGDGMLVFAPTAGE